MPTTMDSIAAPPIAPPMIAAVGVLADFEVPSLAAVADGAEVEDEDDNDGEEEDVDVESGGEDEVDADKEADDNICDEDDVVVEEAEVGKVDTLVVVVVVVTFENRPSDLRDTVATGTEDLGTDACQPRAVER